MNFIFKKRMNRMEFTGSHVPFVNGHHHPGYRVPHGMTLNSPPVKSRIVLTESDFLIRRIILMAPPRFSVNLLANAVGVEGLVVYTLSLIGPDCTRSHCSCSSCVGGLGLTRCNQWLPFLSFGRLWNPSQKHCRVVMLLYRRCHCTKDMRKSRRA